MRKCRRLADKLKILTLAVFMAVSAFFYAPMDVSAEEFTGNGEAYGSTQSYNNSIQEDFGLVDLYPEAQDGVVYKVDMHIRYQMYFGNPMYWRNIAVRYGNIPLISVNDPDSGTSTNALHYVDRTVTVYLDSTQINGKSFNTSSRHIAQTDFGVFNFYSRFTYEITSIVSLSATESEQYYLGYQNGYSEGFDNGEDSGYSSGFQAGVDSVDTDSVYQEGFQAGIDSVDTDGLYQAGYNAGVQVGYQEGYSVGYDDGYADAMARVENWGADTAQYPLVLFESSESFDMQFDFIQSATLDDIISTYCDVDHYFPAMEFNPNHTYRLDFTYNKFSYKYTDSFFTASSSFWLYWGSSMFPVSVGSVDNITSSFYIAGDKIGSGLKFRCDVSSLDNDSDYFGTLHYYLKGCSFKFYDMGPTGDTQNHIANQTDKLTNGYDSSKGNSVSDGFASSVNDFSSTEDSLWSTATTGLEEFQFFDWNSVPAMVTGLSFVATIMTSWFEHAGGSSGVGIVLSILFTVMLIAMALGLYRWYQSRGGKKGG